MKKVVFKIIVISNVDLFYASTATMTKSPRADSPGSGQRFASVPISGKFLSFYDGYFHVSAVLFYVALSTIFVGLPHVR